MKAWLLKDFTGLSALSIAEVPDPSPAAGDVVLQLEFAGLNPADRYLAQNEYPAKPPLPHVLGRDGIGTVIALGAGVSEYKDGQKLLILRGETGVSRFGTFAQRVAVSVDSLAEIPSGWTDQEASGASLVYLTAHQALTQWGNLPPSAVLVTGASGGVGVASVQLAHAMKHFVVCLSRSENKRKKLTEIGADLTIDPAEKNWPKSLREKMNGRRIDLAVDNIGGEEFNAILETMGTGGRISVVGRLAGAVPQFNTASLFFRRLKIGGVAVGTYTHAESRAAWVQIVQTLHSANARPLIDSVFPFDQLPKAFERLASGPMGKVLLDIGRRNT